MKLDPRDIYFSPVNLKRDSEKIEIPYKPIIRCSIPIYSPKGKKKGILIVKNIPLGDILTAQRAALRILLRKF